MIQTPKYYLQWQSSSLNSFKLLITKTQCRQGIWECKAHIGFGYLNRTTVQNILLLGKVIISICGSAPDKNWPRGKSGRKRSSVGYPKGKLTNATGLHLDVLWWFLCSRKNRKCNHRAGHCVEVTRRTIVLGTNCLSKVRFGMTHYLYCILLYRPLRTINEVAFQSQSVRVKIK